MWWPLLKVLFHELTSLLSTPLFTLVPHPSSVSLSFIFQVFYLYKPVDASMDTRLHGTIAMVRQEKNKRLYNLRLEGKVDEFEAVQGTYEIPWFTSIQINFVSIDLFYLHLTSFAFFNLLMLFNLQFVGCRWRLNCVISHIYSLAFSNTKIKFQLYTKNDTLIDAIICVRTCLTNIIPSLHQIKRFSVIFSLHPVCASAIYHLSMISTTRNRCITVSGINSIFLMLTHDFRSSSTSIWCQPQLARKIRSSAAVDTYGTMDIYK